MEGYETDVVLRGEGVGRRRGQTRGCPKGAGSKVVAYYFGSHFFLYSQKVVLILQVYFSK